MEVLSPQIAEEDSEIWLDFIKRDIPQWERYELPKKTNRWYEVYCDLREEVQRSLDADAAKMKMAIDGIKSERERLTPKIISGPRGRGLPGMRPSTRQRYVFYDRKIGGITPAYNKPVSSDPTSWSYHTPSLSRAEFAMSGGKKKSTIFTPQRRNTTLAMPTKHLSTRASQVKQAPRSLIEEHRRPTEQPPSRRNDKEIRAPIAPGRPKQASSASPRQASDSKSTAFSDGESRLRALTSGKATQNTGDVRRAPVSAGESSPAKKISLKRSAQSPPPSTSAMPSESSPQASDRVDQPSAQLGPDTGSLARPVILRKRPDSIFIRPKRKRVA